MDEISKKELFTSYLGPRKNLTTEQIRKLRTPILEALYFLDKNKLQIDFNLYAKLFNYYQGILNSYNIMLDKNIVQATYIDSRTVVQVQPIIDGSDDYTMAGWEKQFTANNLNIQPNTITPINQFRR